MRRSRTVSLTLLAASAVVLQACGDDTDTTDFVVTDVASCVARYGSAAQAECEATFREAQQQHLAAAPHYATVEACREATGNDCETTPATRPEDKTLLTAGAVGAAVAIPVLAGVLVGRMMDNGAGRVTTPLYAGRPPAECAPGAVPQAGAACAPRGSSSGSGGRFYYSGSHYAGTSGTVARGSSAAFTPSPAMARTITTGAGATMGRGGSTRIARGGFGASARSYSSGS